MEIVGKRRGERSAPLEHLTLTGVEGSTVSVRDGIGREYVRLDAAPSLQFTVGGALGHHTVTLLDDAGQERERLTLPVHAQTSISDEGGRIEQLLQMLHYTMLTDALDGIRYDGRVYRYFVRWLRDHVHAMKGMKYYAGDLRDGIDVYRDSQRDDGMIWDNIYPRTPDWNGWDHRFSADGFIRPFDDFTAELKRIPVENDVEYLFVEGLYVTWKATGDDGWMADTLDAAIRALDYSMTDPLRWSARYGLLKRAYTIDTWDFLSEADAIVDGDPMSVDNEQTEFGIMFGDNTGYAVACDQLAAMLEHVGRSEEAESFRQRGADIRARLDALSWNGRFYTHHVPEQRELVRDYGVDEASQVSLSNAYSLNRGISHDHCTAIVETYQAIRDDLPPGSPGEWYTIYPPFMNGFRLHNAPWQYMNGGVSPIVAGELAHGAFQHGYEAYGADILRRLLDLAERHGGFFHSVYTGAGDTSGERAFTPLDLTAYANIDVAGAGADGVPGWPSKRPGDDLAALPSGAQTMAGVPFLIPDPATNGRRGALGLRKGEGFAREIDIPVDATAASVYVVHAVADNGPGGVAGTLTLHYEDGSSSSRYVVRGANASGTWYAEPPSQGVGQATTALAWRGENAVCKNVGVIAWGFDNPHPDSNIARISLSAAADGGFWGVFGITLGHEPVAFTPNPVSAGIPDSWGAAAVVYAVVEGLAGVVDGGVEFDRVEFAPRWPAADVARVAATVVYPDYGGYLAYRYRHDAAQRTIELEMTGSGETCTCHVLLPPDATAATVEGATVTLSRVEDSVYADFTAGLPGPRVIRVLYR